MQDADEASLTRFYEWRGDTDRARRYPDKSPFGQSRATPRRCGRAICRVLSPMETSFEFRNLHERSWCFRPVELCAPLRVYELIQTSVVPPFMQLTITVAHLRYVKIYACLFRNCSTGIFCRRIITRIGRIFCAKDGWSFLLR